MTEDNTEIISNDEGKGRLPDSHLLRAFTLVEGISLLVLLFVAMPLKYIWDMPMAVKILGWIHGALFIALTVIIIRYVMRIDNRNLGLKAFIILMFSAFLPFGWILADKMLFSKLKYS
jgi:integral membrane protein